MCSAYTLSYTLRGCIKPTGVLYSYNPKQKVIFEQRISGDVQTSKICRTGLYKRVTIANPPIESTPKHPKKRR
jgi:hypothetical protein